MTFALIVLGYLAAGWLAAHLYLRATYREFLEIDGQNLFFALMLLTIGPIGLLAALCILGLIWLEGRGPSQWSSFAARAFGVREGSTDE